MEKTAEKTGKKFFTTQNMTLIALMTALMCVLGPISIPIGPVPITPVLIVMFLTVYILGTKRAAIATLIYILIGLVGVPVFSSFSAGPSKLFGPTGGYIVAYIPMVLIAGFLISRCRGKVILEFLSMVVSLAFLYLMGTVWLMVLSGMTFMAALAAGVLPFIVIDLCKIVVALFLGKALKRRLPVLREG